MTDRRKKGCPNEDCERHQKKVKLAATEVYCPKCGAELIFVCEKCFKEIEDLGPEHRKCALCEAKAEEQREKIKEAVKKGGKYVAAIAMAIGGKVAADFKNDAVKKGAKIIEDTVRKIPKKK